MHYRRNCVFVFSLVCLLFLSINQRALSQYTVDETTLNSYNGVHPRLFLDTAKVNSLKTTIANPPAGTRWTDIWVRFKTVADRVAVKPPAVYTTPGSSDEQLWQREVGDNIAILSMAYLLTKTSPSSGDTLWIEAEDAALASPMTAQSDTSVSGQRYTGTPVGGAINNPNVQPPSANYNFLSRYATYYHVWARVYAPSANANNFWTKIDGEEHNVATSTYRNWIWVNCGHWHLTPGNHTLAITYQEQGLLIDKYVITTDNALVPSGLGTEQHWFEAENFTLNANGVAPHLNNLVVTTSNSQATSGDILAQGDKWLESWPGEGQTTTVSATAIPDAQQTVTVTGGAYDVWVRFKSPYVGHQSFFFALDSGAYSVASLDGTVAFPYAPLVSPTLLDYNKTIAAPYNNYPYREWVWKKIASNVSLSAGDHLLKISNRDSNGGASCELDQFLVAATGSITPSEPNKYLAGLQQWAVSGCNYPTWGTGSYAGNDLAASHMLQGLSIAYDWVYGSFGLTDKQLIGNTLSTRGATMYNALPTVWWRSAYLQNHSYVSLTGLTAAGLAIRGDSGMPETLPWLQAAMGKINNTLADLGSDGVDHEGAAYWGSMEFLLKYLDLSKKLMGADMFAVPWLQKTANYRLYFDLPQNTLTTSATHINFSDDPGIEWNGPNYILRKLASAYNLPTAQWQAGLYDDKKLNRNDSYAAATSPWLDLLWYNPAIAETSPTNAGLSPFGYFDDLEFVVARTGWDGGESVVAYQCGPFLGHDLQVKNTTNYTDWGGNHVHPAANNFCIFSSGEWLIRNAGYTYKFSAYENTLLVGGVGQKGEGAFTFNGKAAHTVDMGGVLNPSIDNTISFTSPALDYLVGNADQAYPTASGVTKYRRHLLFLKPDVLLVVDDVTLSAAKTMELRFFPQQQSTTLSSGIYVTTGTKAKLYFKPLRLPAQMTTSTKTISVTQNNGTNQNRLAYSLATSTATTSLSTAVAFSWSPVSTTPKTVLFIADSSGSAWKFKAGTQTVVLARNSATESAKVVTCLEAESAALTAPVEVRTDDSEASGGQYITAVAGSPVNSPDTLIVPNAQYSVTLPTAGVYSVWARIKAPSSTSNSLWTAINPTTGTIYSSASTSTYGTWIWVRLFASQPLNAGTNILAIKYRQAECHIDQFVITDDNVYTPSEIY